MRPILVRAALVAIFGLAGSGAIAEDSPDAAAPAPAGRALGAGFEYDDLTLARFARLLQTDAWSLAAPPRNDKGMIEVRHGPTGLTFVLIPTGLFPMGTEDHWKDALPIRVVRVSAFLLCQTECPQREWDMLGGKDGRQWAAPDLPVDSVSFEDAREGVIRAGLRLPSEAEWEFAARATRWTYDELKKLWGRRSRLDRRLLSDHAWLRENSDLRTHPVATKPPNPWGLFDMLGNVYEWCEDATHGSYAGAPLDGTPRPANAQSHRVVRGGSWHSGRENCRESFRNSCAPRIRHPYNGFRPAATLPVLDSPGPGDGPQDEEAYPPPHSLGEGHAYEWWTLFRFQLLLARPDWSPASPIRNPQGMLEAVHEKTGLTFVLIPAGIVTVGKLQKGWFAAPFARFPVQPFLISRTECTGIAWVSGGSVPAGSPGSPRLPIYRVTFRECRDWCDRIGLRLPLEAEWVHAHEAGKSLRDWLFRDSKRLERIAWFEANSKGPQEVGGKLPNAWGLFDTYGNVAEWCAGFLGTRGDSPEPRNLRPVAVARGGCCWDIDYTCTHFDRTLRDPRRPSVRIGFRPAADLPELR